MRIYTINPGQSRRFDAPVSSITAARGTVSVSQVEDRVPATTLEQGETLECQNRAGFTIAPVSGGATVSVVFEDEATTTFPKGKRANTARGRAEARKAKRSKRTSKVAPRGDTGGDDSGGFESRTIKQLRAEAKKQKVPGRSKMDKGQLIAALRKVG